MARKSAPLSSKSHALISAAAAFTAGALLGARSGRATPTRVALTLAAIGLTGLALAEPSSAALERKGKRRRSGSVRISLVVPRPVEQVFALCADFETFPRLLPNLERVTDYGDGRSHWWARTPGGGIVEWNTITNKFVTNTVIGWRSVPGSPVEMSGTLRFSPEGDGTCLRIALEYQVQSSSLRDSIAALLAPRNGPQLERQIRALAWRLAEEPEKLAHALPPVVSSDGVATMDSKLLSIPAGVT
jgi:uncharacterized membrane protein